MRRPEPIPFPTAVCCALLGTAVPSQEPKTPPVYWPGAAWATLSPTAAGLDADILKTTTKYVLDQDSQSFLVLRRGKLVVEAYGEGGGQEETMRIASCTKSMVAILVGMALDAKKLPSLDHSAAAYVPPWQKTKKSAITLRHLLSMTSGLNPRGVLGPGGPEDLFLRSAQMPLTAKPGTVWRYNTPAYRMLFRVLETATGQDLAAWSRTKLTGPLGMRHTRWNTHVIAGRKNYLNLDSSARDMARFGLFVLRGGKWRDQQLVSKTFLRTAVTPSQKANPAYGLLFWLNAKPGRAATGRGTAHRFPGAPKDLIACLGARGQHIIAIPSEDLVIVRQGNTPRDRQLPQRFVRMVLSAIQNGGFAKEPVRPRSKQDSTPQIFLRLDRDRDGFLNRAEFTRSRIGRADTKLFDQLDANRDGKLSVAEALQANRRR